MSIVAAVKKGFGVAVQNLRLILVLIAFNVIFNLVSIPFAGQPPLAMGTGLAIAALAFSVIFILASIFIQGGVLGSLRDAVKAGAVNLANFVKYGGKFYARLLGLGVVMFLLILVVGLIAALIVAVSAPIANPIVSGIAAGLAIIIGALGIYMILLLFLSPYALVSGDVGVVAALKSSMQFVRKNLLNVIGLVVLLILISLGIGLIVTLITGALTFVIKAATVSQIIMGLINSVLNAYVTVIVTAALMAFYLGSAASQDTSPQS